MAKTWAYLFPSRDLYCPSIVSFYTVPRIRGLSYMRSALYLRARGSKAERRDSLCGVFDGILGLLEANEPSFT